MENPKDLMAMSRSYSAPFTPPESPIKESEAVDSHTYPKPTILEHVEEANDLMSGAVGEGDEVAQLPDNDSTVCSDNFRDQLNYMPFRLLNARELIEMKSLFEDPVKAFNVLTENFWTTIYGLHCAVRERQGAPVEDRNRDTIVLGAFARRGGFFDLTDGEHGDVRYPEHLTPFIGEEERIYDKEYWDVIFSQGKLWEEMRDNRIYPRYSGVNLWLT